ncbi:hypothetical protein QOZ80_4AG0304720 [Eleusine coracana subsp. coracana]|nr:hypothetical protein QOZ80_4AG0304720 [Eleusine coracana subsp. coracana]
MDSSQRAPQQDESTPAPIQGATAYVAVAVNGSSDSGSNMDEADSNLSFTRSCRVPGYTAFLDDGTSPSTSLKTRNRDTTTVAEHPRKKNSSGSNTTRNLKRGFGPMANCKALIVTAMLLCLSFVRSQGDVGSVAPSSPEQEQEIQMLRAKVASLEDEINRRNEETLELESAVRERTAQTAALIAELDVLQKVNVADDESVMKASTQNALLEEQIQRLGSDLEDQVKKGESLEVRATEAEKSWQELNRKLKRVKKTDAEQKKKIRELDGKLQQVQAKLAELEKEAKMKDEELAKVHGMWLPHWLAVHAVRCQELASAKWQVHGKPMFDPLMQKVAEKLTHGQQLVEPHLQSAQNLAKVRMDSLRNTTAPYVSAVATKSTSAYKMCRDAVQPYTEKAQELAIHHWQESKKRTQPYINQIVAASEPHLCRANVVLEPYLRPVTSFWRRLASSTSLYHGQVQKGVKHLMEDNEVLKPLSDDRLTWFTASALFTLTMFSIYMILSAAFCSKRVRAKQSSGQSRSCARKNTRRVDEREG